MRKNFVLIIALLLVLVAGGLTVQMLRQTKPISDQNTLTSASTPVPGWKTFEDNNIKISYPSDWKVNTDTQGDKSLLVTLQSSDYVQSIAGFPEKGYTVSLFLIPPITESPYHYKVTELQALKTVKWLNQEVTLQKVTYDSNALSMQARFKGSTYGIRLDSVYQVPAETHTDLFLQVANTLEIK